MGMIATYQSLSNAHFNIVLKVNTYADLPEIDMTKALMDLSEALLNHHLLFPKKITVQHQKTFGISSG